MLKAEGLSSIFHHTSCSIERAFLRELFYLDEDKQRVTELDRIPSLKELHILQGSTQAQYEYL